MDHSEALRHVANNVTSPSYTARKTTRVFDSKIYILLGAIYFKIAEAELAAKKLRRGSPGSSIVTKFNVRATPGSHIGSFVIWIRRKKSR